MNILFCYFLGMFLTLGLFLVINYKHKWIDKDDVREACNEGYVALWAGALIIWPFILVFLIFWGIGYIIYKYLIPD